MGAGLSGSARLPRIHARSARRRARRVAGGVRSGRRGARQQGARDDERQGPREDLPADPDEAELGGAVHPAAPADAGVCLDDGSEGRGLQRGVSDRRHSDVGEVAS